MPKIQVPISEIDQWHSAKADLKNDKYADPNGENSRLADELQTIDASTRETADCVAVRFLDFDEIGYPTDATITIVIPDGAIYPCADWGGAGPKPLADHWFWSNGPDGPAWVAVREAWEPEWWTSGDPELLAERPAVWSYPIHETPTTARLCYRHNEHEFVDMPAARAINYKRLLDHYRFDPASQEGSSSSPPERFALAMIESRGDTSDNYVTTARSFDDACALAGDEILDSGRVPDAVYDLDTGARLEVHTTTPVVTRSEDQEIMVNPLADSDGERR